MDCALAAGLTRGIGVTNVSRIEVIAGEVFSLDSERLFALYTSAVLEHLF